MDDAASVEVFLAGPLSTPKPASAPKAWKPKGYWLYSESIAAKWLKNRQFDCQYSGARCWGMLVLPRFGCSHLYVELSVLDGRGNVIGYTNDAVGAVRAGRKAKLIFNTFDRSARGAELSEISCIP